ncbi:MAG: sialidase family protein [Acidobacteriota bacterium]|nr:sialidase family protein [Acidobacteriota bacterium]
MKKGVTMEKTTRGLFLAWMLISLVLLGCGSSQVDDSSFEADLSFRESITVGDPESNPSGPYLVTSKNNEVLVSWTEENIDGEGRNVLIATVTSDGRQLDEIRQMNHEPSGSRGGEHKAKFTLGEDDAISSLFIAFTDIYKHRVMKSTFANGGGPFSSELRLNDDQGELVNRDGKEVSRANFTAIGTAPGGKVYVAWLDGRNDLEAKEVFMAVSEDGGRSFSKNYPISALACPCCRPEIDFLDGGKSMVVTYRDNGSPSADGVADNVRNHLMIRSNDGGQTFGDPVVISDDGWTSKGCPHAGISIAVDSEDRIHAIWWTGGRTPDEAGIYYTYSEDGGKSFGPRQFISDAPADRVLHTEVTVDKNDTVYVAWENVKEDKSRIFLAHRSVSKGEWSPIYQVSGGTWSTFYPMLTTDDKSLYVSWTERNDESSQIRLQTSPLAGS